MAWRMSKHVSVPQLISVSAVGLWRGDVWPAVPSLRRYRGRDPLQTLHHLCVAPSRRSSHGERFTNTWLDNLQWGDCTLQQTSLMGFLLKLSPAHLVIYMIFFETIWWLPKVLVIKINNSPANAGDISDLGSIAGLGRSPGEGHGNQLQYSCLENPMDRGIWRLKSTGYQGIRQG